MPPLLSHNDSRLHDAHGADISGEHQRCQDENLGDGESQCAPSGRNVTLLTGQAKVTDAIGAAIGTWINMLDLKRDILCSTVRTLPLPLHQQVLASLVALQRALLILNAADVRVLHEVRIEAHHLQTHRVDRTVPRKTAYPGQDIHDPAFQ